MENSTLKRTLGITIGLIIGLLLLYLINGNPWTKPQINPDTENDSTADTNLFAVHEMDCDYSDFGLSMQAQTNPFFFCHPEEWGDVTINETTISPQKREGTIFYVKFSGSENNTPLISYSTLDYQRLGDTDVPPIIDWSALDFGKEPAELAKLLPDSENSSAEILNLNGWKILKVNRKFIDPLSYASIDRTDYFIPKLTFGDETYNLHIAGSPLIESQTEILIQSMYKSVSQDETITKQGVDKDALTNCQSGGIISHNVDLLRGRYFVNQNSAYHYNVPGGCLSKIEDADIENFRVLNLYFAKDKNHVYQNDRVLEGADPATFEAIDAGIGISCPFGEDKNGVHIHTFFQTDMDGNPTESFGEECDEVYEKIK